MKKLLLIISMFILIINNGKSQTWEKLFGGYSYDIFRCVIEVPSGGFIAAGYTSYNNPAVDTDGYVVRLNTSGDTIWTFTYNGPMSQNDLFYKVINTIDGGFALCGYTTSVTGLNDDILILKLNSSGQQQWVKFYGGSGKERAQDIIQTPDGKYALAGYTTTSPALYYDAFLLRTNSTGDSLWEKRYGAANYDDANSLQVLSDGGFILGGQSQNGTNGLDQYLIRTNSTGDTLWTKKNGTLLTDNIECIRVLTDGYIMAGSSDSISAGNSNGYLVKTDTSGTVLWAKSYGDTVPDDFHDVELTTGGGFIMSGTTSSWGPLSDAGAKNPNLWLVRTNSTGDTLWTRTFGGANHDHGYSGRQTSDGGYIIAGFSSSFGYNVWDDAYVVKTDSSGNVSNHLTYTTVLAIVSPTSSTCGSANTQIKLKLINFGNQSVPNIPVTVQITGSLTQTIPQTFSASSDTVTLTTTINTTAGGTYTFYCFTSNNNDVTPSRNSITATFTIPAVATAPTVTSNSRCGNGTVPLSASATGTIYWYAVSSGGSPVNTGTTYTTPSLSSTTTYYVQTNLTCPSPRIPVIATVNPISPDPIVVSNSHCGPAILTLSATDPDPVTWYDAPTGGNIVGTGLIFTTPLLSGTTNYYAQSTNGNCPSNMVIATAMISSVAADPVTTSSMNCGPGTVTLAASSVDSVLWFDAASGGSQVGTGHAFTTPLITTTTIYYAQANNGCLSNRIAATATIHALPVAPVTTSNHNCGPGTVNLSATAIDPITWYDAAVGGIPVGSGTTFTTPVISSNTTYYAETNDGTCSSNRIVAIAAILSLPNVNLGPDTFAFSPAYLLDAGPGFSGYSWSTGATTQALSVTTSGTFCVTVTDISGCSNNDCVFVDFYTGVSGISLNNLISFYPNPSSGKISASIPESISNVKIEVINITGQTLKQINAGHSAFIDIDLSSFPKGIYLLRINIDGNSELQKIIIQ